MQSRLLETELRQLWADYRRTYMPTGEYARDPLRAGHVTSEAQSYALLQTAWLNDRAAFEQILDWTNSHLQRDDGLYSWLWDPSGGGRIVDRNTATDADIDIAFALTVAAAAFDRADYELQARRLVRSIRLHSAIDVGPDWYLSAGNWARSERIINLSYFAPYAFARFEAIDPGMGWTRVIEVGYDLLERATGHTPTRLPPDFVVLTPEGSLQELPASSALSRTFSYDGIRIPWRVELDCQIRGDQRACRPQPLARRLAEIWAKERKLGTRYSGDGAALTVDESMSFYGALLPSINRIRPDVATIWMQSHLGLQQLATMQRATDRYYDANWAWFGLAAARGFIAARTPPWNTGAQLGAPCPLRREPQELHC